METINDLLGYEDIKIYQNPEMFSFSLDSVLLPNFVTINKNIKNILDIGTGNAPIPLILSTKTNANITAVEIQKDVYALAQKTVKINNLENQINLINADIKQIYQTMEPNYYDVITCNPPYFKVTENSNLNKNDYKTIARHEVELNLDNLCQIVKRLLKNDGIFALVHRPERLHEILETMTKYNLEPKKIMFIYPKEHQNANTVLIEARLNANKGLKVLPPLIAHTSDGQYTNEIKQYFK